MHRIIPKLKELTSKEFIQLTERGNQAIDISLTLAKQLGKTTVLIQDQGGWIHYKKAPNNIDLNIQELKTDYGIINLEELEKNANNNSVLLITSMAGYIANNDMKSILEVCNKKGTLLINDISGSIGTDAAKIGHVLVCSFGKWKPINLEYGGFIATGDNDLYTEFDASYFNEEEYNSLFNKLEQLPERLTLFKETRDKILDELQTCDIIHKDKHGLNVIIKLVDDEIRERIINYCNENNLEYVFCPKYIRVNEDAISIEIKRK